MTKLHGQRVHYTVTGTGADEIQEAAEQTAAAYAPGRGWEVLSIDARPLVTAGDGGVALWEASVEALVWAER